jgi:cystathionine beta-synthase
MIYENVLETIGNTPLIRLNRIAKGIKPAILAKVEYFNPGGSVKDRIGIKMLLDAEEKGLIKKGGTIVEPTSGNTGVGLAIAAALKGYKMVFTMPDKMSREKELLLKAYGAEVIRTPTAVAPDDPKSYYKVAERIVKETPNAFSPNQYFNQNNPKAHFETTGPEIWRGSKGKLTHFVAGMGTGGTITGVAKYLKEKNPGVGIIGVDPEGSIYHHKFYKKRGKIHPYKTEGIGEDFIPETIELGLIDEVVIVSDRDAFLTARRLAKEEGLLVGGSSGAAVFAALKTAKKLDRDKVIVVLLPDTGRNYLSTVFSDEWMEKNGFLGGKT